MLKRLTDNWVLVLLLALSVLTILPILSPGYFSHHDDLHVIRIFEMRKCLADGQIPCRWVQDMGYGNGYPLFNYYNPFIYYLGAGLSFLVGYVGAAKLLFFISLLLGPFSMYLFGRELFGKYAGLVSAVLFMFVPYRALDAYVRGAVSELFAISLIPLIALFIYRLMKSGRTIDFFELTVTSAAFLLSHNVSLVIWGPFLALWTLVSAIRGEKKNIIKVVFAGLLAFGLSAFFTIPAFIEKGLVTTESLTFGDLNFHVHFAGLSQLFTSRFWGYGASVLGPNDMLSFQIGWPHAWIALSATAVVALYSFRKTTNKKNLLIPITLIVFFIGALFMTHNKSTAIWEHINLIGFLQFPWRYLGVPAVATAALGGYVTTVIPDKFRNIFIVIVVALTISLNYNYFRPEKYYPTVTDETKLTGASYDEQIKGALQDYLPKTAIVPIVAAPSEPKFITGKGMSTDFDKRSNSFTFNVFEGSTGDVEVPVFNFPNWKVDNHTIATSSEGRIVVKEIRADENKITGHFENTPVRTFSNIITLGSLGIFLILILKKWRKLKNS